MRINSTTSIWYKIKELIVNTFFPKLCYACSCTDCQLMADGRSYWYCPHLRNDICSICCIYDSTDPHWNWKECSFCGHDEDREK